MCVDNSLRIEVSRYLDKQKRFDCCDKVFEQLKTFNWEMN